ncbi:MAG: hypothetical protein ACKVJE_19750 [Pseudomonadales bacterium]|jgi:glycosyltransferase involved in cell wall biosynthesis
MAEVMKKSAISNKFFVVEERPNPTTDLYLIPKLLAKGVDMVKLSFDDLPAVTQLTGATVIFVRYVPKKWKVFVTEHRGVIHDVVFFMDDDLFDLRATKGTPVKYRFKLARLSTSRQPWLKNMGAQLWLSTPHLMQKYADWNPVHVYPRAMVRRRDIVQVFYHGSSSHQREIHWLYDVMKAVLVEDENIAFEIIGGREVNKQFKSLPRTTVLHPMSWLTYKTLLCQPGRAIGLAPLLDEPFNHARSYTKFFDITQAGAVGIFATESQFAEVVEDQVNGRLVAMDKSAWVAAILELARSPEKRTAMYQNALNEVDHLVEHEI